ncbi:MAG TPA: LysR substrate-binding domain-containing protein [Mycobacteriales bacterium]|jgi:DNA-binding transcriptional LysR family regulator|nr:LysR substrate-binding domain-containing protein [Mycobacteriales bacterium]
MADVYDPVQLRSFLAVARAQSFTRAARRLGLQQSTVSQHVGKLERAAGRQLLLRDTHAVALTADGEAMAGFARSILTEHDRAQSWFAGSPLRGRLRFGASEDLVLSHLPQVLRDFRHSHPLVDLELTVELSTELHRRLRSGSLDLVYAKRSPGETHGQLVSRERMVWIGAPGLRLDRDGPVPIVVYPAPSITRAHALRALREAGRPWQITCTSGSLSGLRAAALAELGVLAFTRSLIPPGLVELPSRSGLPELGEVEVVLLSGSRAEDPPVAALGKAIRDSGARA